MHQRFEGKWWTRWPCLFGLGFGFVECSTCPDLSCTRAQTTMATWHSLRALQEGNGQGKDQRYTASFIHTTSSSRDLSSNHAKRGGPTIGVR